MVWMVIDPVVRNMSQPTGQTEIVQCINYIRIMFFVTLNMLTYHHRPRPVQFLGLYPRKNRRSPGEVQVYRMEAWNSHCRPDNFPKPAMPQPETC